MFQVELPMLPGIELGPVSLNKRQQNEEVLFQKHSRRVFPNVSQFPMRETLVPVAVLVSKIQIMLTLHGREF